MKAKLWQRLVQAFQMAPADKMILAMLIASTMLSGLIGVALDSQFMVSGYVGLLLTATTVWWIARRARIQRERTAANIAASVLATVRGAK